ncbi:MAG: Uma2 family endonuclease [Bryobacterales bacterium]|nr:Uma2 family endonuclease [Bryobacterales bacterium]
MARNRSIRQHVEAVRPRSPPLPRRPPPAPPPGQPPEDVHYPDSDGTFLLQNAKHNAELLYAGQAVEQHLRDAPSTVLTDVAFYFKEGDNKAVLAPDLSVTLDHEFTGPKTYKTWVEGRLPDFILEVVSPSSATNDKKLKKGTYELLGIREYFVYDPDAEQPWVAVQGYRLDEETKKYGQALKRDKRGAVRSRALGVSLRAEGSRLVVRNTRTGEDYVPTGKVRKRLERAVAERNAERDRADQLAAERDAERGRADQLAAALEDKDREIQELKRQMAAQERFSLNEGSRELGRGR